MPKYRARCNQRACQARRTIEGVYDPNDRPGCHVPGCKGLMYEDSNRKTKARRVKDATGGVKMCRCGGTTFGIGRMSMRNAPHKWGQVGCIYREDYLLQRGGEPPSKHSPHPNGNAPTEPDW